MNSLCPFCEKGTLRPSTRIEYVEHGGKHLSVHDFQFSTCEQCHEEMVRADEAKANQRRIADAILSAEGKLSTADLKCIRLRHSLNQVDAAKIFGGGPNAFSKYERGEVQQSKSMDLLVRVYDAVPAAREFLELRSGIYRKPQWTSDESQTEFHISKVRPRPSTRRVLDGVQPWEDSDIERMHAFR